MPSDDRPRRIEAANRLLELDEPPPPEPPPAGETREPAETGRAGPGGASSPASTSAGAVALPLVDGHAQLEAAILQDGARPPDLGPGGRHGSYVRDRDRDDAATPSLPSDLAGESGTRDARVALRGLGQLDDFDNALRKERGATDRAASAMLTMALDLGFTPIHPPSIAGAPWLRADDRLREGPEAPCTFAVVAASERATFRGVGIGAALQQLLTATTMEGWRSQDRVEVTCPQFVVVEPSEEEQTMPWSDGRRLCTPHQRWVHLNAWRDGDGVLLARRSSPSPTRTVAVFEEIRRRLMEDGLVFTVTLGGVVAPGSQPLRAPEGEDPSQGWVTFEDAVYTASAEGERPTCAWFHTRRDADYARTIDQAWRGAARFPGRIWPMVAYDPRRANALLHAKAAVPDRGHVGVKVSPRTGWMPLGNRALYGERIGATLDQRNRDLFGWLEGRDIGLVSHTSPAGWPPVILYPAAFTNVDRADDELLPPNPYVDHNGQPRDPAASVEQSPPWRLSWQDVGALHQPQGPGRWHDEVCAWARAAEREEALTWAVLQRAARLVHRSDYLNRCASPSAWRPVLEEFPGLRLGLAHLGGGLELDSHLVAAAAGAQASAAPPRPVGICPPQGAGEPQDLAALLGAAVVAARGGERPDDRMPAYVDQLLATPAWQAWLRAWTRRWDNRWLCDILEMCSDHEHVYADLAHLTGEPQEVAAVMEPLITEGLKQQTLYRKGLLGSNWFVVQGEGLSAQQAWGLLRGAFEHHAAARGARAWEDPAYLALWERWSSENALRFVNLDKRMSKLEAAYRESRVKEGMPEDLRRSYDASCQALPAWWDVLKGFYKG